MLGGIIYVIFRSESLLLFQWCKVLNIENSILEIRKQYVMVSVPDFILYNLPDMLWICAYILIIDSIWLDEKRNKSTLLWVNLLPTLSATNEILQYYGISNGTFDYIDLFVFLLPAGLYNYIYVYEKS